MYLNLLHSISTIYKKNQESKQITKIIKITKCTVLELSLTAWHKGITTLSAQSGVCIPHLELFIKINFSIRRKPRPTPESISRSMIYTSLSNLKHSCVIPNPNLPFCEDSSLVLIFSCLFLVNFSLLPSVINPIWGKWKRLKLLYSRSHWTADEEECRYLKFRNKDIGIAITRRLISLNHSWCLFSSSLWIVPN